MTKNEIFAKNLVLSTEFDRYVLEHLDFAEQIPVNALVVLLPEYDQELCEINKNLAERQREKNQSIVYVHIAKIAPQISRLVDVSLENVA